MFPIMSQSFIISIPFFCLGIRCQGWSQLAKLLGDHDAQENFRAFFNCYNKLLEDGDYVTKRQAGPG